MTKPIKMDEPGYRTLKNVLIGCIPSVPEVVLKTFYSYKGLFPVTFEVILGNEFMEIVETIGKNVFVNLQIFAKEHSTSCINTKAVCLYFGGPEHVEAINKCPMVYPDLKTKEKRIVGDQATAYKVIKIKNGLIAARSIYNKDLIVEGVIDPSGKAKVGSIVIIHLTTVIVVDPSDELLRTLFNLQKDFREQYLLKVTNITYDATRKATLKRMKNYGY